MWVYLLPNAHTGQNSYRPSAIQEWIDTIELRDDNNTSMTNSHRIAGDMLKYSEVARKLDTGVFLSSSSYFWSFGPNPFLCYQERVQEGYEWFNNTNVSITTKAGLSSATYEVVFIIPTYSMLEIHEDGMVTYDH
jgi:hypothetical protein